jgi:hypothetical protein
VPLGALQHEPCSFEDVCALRSLCTEAYTKHVRATDATAAVRARLAGDAGLGTDAAVEMARRLAAGEKDLAESVKLARRCADQQGEVKRRYGL